MCSPTHPDAPPDHGRWHSGRSRGRPTMPIGWPRCSTVSPPSESERHVDPTRLPRYSTRSNAAGRRSTADGSNSDRALVPAPACCTGAPAGAGCVDLSERMLPGARLRGLRPEGCAPIHPRAAPVRRRHRRRGAADRHAAVCSPAEASTGSCGPAVTWSWINTRRATRLRIHLPPSEVEELHCPVEWTGVS